MTGNPTGRPSKLTSSLCEQAEAAVYDYPALRFTAAILDIHVDTLGRWVRRGDKVLKLIDLREYEPSETDEMYLRFSRAIKRGLCRLYKDCCTAIMAGLPGWQGRAWMLERRFPEDCGVNGPEIRGIHKKLKELAAAKMATAGHES